MVFLGLIQYRRGLRGGVAVPGKSVRICMVLITGILGISRPVIPGLTLAHFSADLLHVRYQVRDTASRSSNCRNVGSLQSPKIRASRPQSIQTLAQE